MAHKILGIDLGSWSVKVVELAAGFRQARLVGLHERTLAERGPEESALACAARTVGALVSDLKLGAEMRSTALGHETTLRLLRMPFSDPKKIEQVLGYELESQIMGELDTLVYDSIIAGRAANAKAEDGTNVIAVAAERERVREQIEALAAVGLEPRQIGAASLSYAALYAHAFNLPGVTHAVIDYGHRHTELCIVRDGAVLFARSIGRGAEELTLTLAEAFRMSLPDAEVAKHSQAFVGVPGQPLPSAAHQRVDEVVRGALRPLLRELRQTFAAFRAEGESGPDKVWLTGGGARLTGLVEYFGHELGIETATLALHPDDPFLDPPLAARARQGEPKLGPLLPAQALGLALAAAIPVPQVNLRKGELVYRTDYSFFRGKAGFFAAAVLAILAFAGIDAVASLRGLRRESEALETQLTRETKALFGDARLDGKAVSQELRNGPRGGVPPVPTMTAYDVLDEISRHVPAADKGKLDILELEVKPKKTYLKGTAETAGQIDQLAVELGKIECFESVAKGKISTTTGPAGEGAGDKPRELKQFTIDITTSCP